MYIGKANNPEERRKRHLSVAKTGHTESNKYLAINGAIAKHGSENFIFFIIEECESPEEAYQREPYWIAEFRTRDKRFGYNIAPGGAGGPQRSAEDIAKTTAAGIRTRKINAMSLKTILRDLKKLFFFIPNYKADIYRIPKQNINEITTTTMLYFNSYYAERQPTYDIGDKNKTLTDELKLDVLNLYKKLTRKQISTLLYLTESQMNYIIGRYNKTGISTEQQKTANRSDAHKGKTHSEKTKEKLRISSTGKTHKPEIIEQLSKDRMGAGNPMYNKTHSAETKKKQSEFQSARERKPLTNEHKQTLRDKTAAQNHYYRIPKETKDQVIILNNTNQYTKQQIGDKLGLKRNTVVSIVRAANKKE
jgi:hypothetical protein